MFRKTVQNNCSLNDLNNKNLFGGFFVMKSLYIPLINIIISDILYLMKDTIRIKYENLNMEAIIGMMKRMSINDSPINPHYFDYRFFLDSSSDGDIIYFLDHNSTINGSTINNIFRGKSGSPYLLIHEGTQTLLLDPLKEIK